jgi:hypothetical protein
MRRLGNPAFCGRKKKVKKKFLGVVGQSFIVNAKPIRRGLRPHPIMVMAMQQLMSWDPRALGTWENNLG